MMTAWRSQMTEVGMWALLHQANVEWEGEWINARYLVSGHRTNPWSQEATLKVIEPGEIIGCDSDLIGPYGYASDVSRTWLSSGRPTDRQHRLYAESFEHVQANIEMYRPGVSFLELMERNYRLPQASTSKCSVPMRTASALRTSGQSSSTHTSRTSRRAMEGP